MSVKNIVLFGESGAGKSSVINLMAGLQMAKTSSSTERCTLQWEEHSISFDGYNYKVFDTVGLEEPQLGMKAYLDVIVDAHNLITKLQQEGGIDLLLFCVRASRVSATIQSNYRLFHDFLCEKKVPTVLILTGLEREARMEDWWDRNGRMFNKYDMNFAGHACITAAHKLDGRHKQLYEDSRHLVRNLVIQRTHGGTYTGGEAWYKRVMQMLWGLTMGNIKRTPKRRDIIAVLTKHRHMTAGAANELALKISFNLSGR